MALLRRLLLSAAGIYVTLVVLVYLLQRRMQYFPERGAVPVPQGTRYAGLVDVELTAADGVPLKAWHWPGSRDLTLVFFHGNAGHRGHRLDWIERFNRLGWGIFILDYRGYGGSGGTPTEAGLLLDAAAVAGHLAGQRLAYVGESIGSGVAVALAARHPPEALVLHGSALSLAQVGKHHYPWLPVGLLMKDRFDCTEPLRRVRVPLLCIHGDRDRIVPPEFGRALFEAAAEPKEWYPVAGAGHNDLPWVGGQAYYARVHAFLERVAAGPG